MAIQVPGSVLFCATIIAGDGTDWTSWLPYAVTGAMQATLLVRENHIRTDLRSSASPGGADKRTLALTTLGTRSGTLPPLTRTLAFFSNVWNPFGNNYTACVGTSIDIKRGGD
jgi:hypothetical protein